MDLKTEHSTPEVGLDQETSNIENTVKDLNCLVEGAKRFKHRGMETFLKNSFPDKI